jgi:hypothetical protein
LTWDLTWNSGERPSTNRLSHGAAKYRVMVGNLNERNHFEDIGVDGRIILKYLLKK